jgi:hypothetical protein
LVLYPKIGKLVPFSGKLKFHTWRGPTAHRTVVHVFNLQSDEPGAQWHILVRISMQHGPAKIPKTQQKNPISAENKIWEKNRSRRRRKKRWVLDSRVDWDVGSKVFGDGIDLAGGMPKVLVTFFPKFPILWLVIFQPPATQ